MRDNLDEIGINTLVRTGVIFSRSPYGGPVLESSIGTGASARRTEQMFPANSRQTDLAVSA